MGMFRRKSDAAPDPQDLLPAELRTKWAVVPKFVLYQVFVAAFLIGAGTMASILGITLGPEFLWYGLPLALVLCFLQVKILGRVEDRLLRDLDERRRGA